MPENITAVLVVLLVFLIYILIGEILVNIASNLAFAKVDYSSNTKYLENYAKYIEIYRREEVDIPIKNYHLKGYLFAPSANLKSKPKGLLIFGHGLWVDHREYIAEITFLIDKGWQVLAYDGTGSGVSDGNSTRGLVQSALDMNAVLEYVNNHEDLKDMEKVIFGHSWGGFGAAVNMGKLEHNIKAAVTVSTYAYPVETLVNVVKDVIGPFAYIFYPFIWGRNFKEFGKNYNLNAVDALNNSEAPTLVIHGQNDTFLGIDSSALFAHRNEINKDNVHFIRWREPDRNGHSSILAKQNFATDENVQVVIKDFIDVMGKNKDMNVARAIHEASLLNKEVDNNVYNERLMIIVDYFLSRYIRK